MLNHCMPKARLFAWLLQPFPCCGPNRWWSRRNVVKKDWTAMIVAAGSWYDEAQNRRMIQGINKGVEQDQQERSRDVECSVCGDGWPPG